MKINVKINKSAISPYKVGDVVGRVTDWDYSTQDCDDYGNPTEGTIVEILKNNQHKEYVLRIQWGNGHFNVYKNKDVKLIRRP